MSLLMGSLNSKDIPWHTHTFLKRQMWQMEGQKKTTLQQKTFELLTASLGHGDKVKELPGHAGDAPACWQLEFHLETPGGWESQENKMLSFFFKLPTGFIINNQSMTDMWCSWMKSVHVLFDWESGCSRGLVFSSIIYCRWVREHQEPSIMC